MSGDHGYFKEDCAEYLQCIEQLDKQLEDSSSLYKIRCTSVAGQNVAAFLRAKNAVMAQYLTYVNLYALHKVNVGGLDAFPLDELLYRKTLLQKMAQTQKKLQYQIDKLSRVTAIVQQSSEEDENDNVKLTFKPRVDNLVKDDNAANNQGSSGKYIPPKLTATLSKDDKMKVRQERKTAEHKNLIKTKMLKGFVDDQETDKPKHVTEKDYQQLYYGRAEDDKQKQKRLYEEEMMIRLPETKAEKKREKMAERNAQITRLDDFDELDGIKSMVQPKKAKTPHRKSTLKGSLKRKFKKKR